MQTKPLTEQSRQTDAPPRMALRPAEAAKAIGISRRLLWSETNAGRIPCVRIGKAVLYPVNVLETWLKEKVQRGQVSE